MVFALAGGLASLGLALPQGLAFGYGYGYGVRAGYHAYKPSQSSVTKQLHLSSNPIQGAQGAGLLSAEEMTGVPMGMTNEPSLKRESSKMVEPTTNSSMIDMNQVRATTNPYSDQHLIHSPYSNKEIPFSDFRSREDFKRFVKTGYIPVYLRRSTLRRH